jgi:REP element-mobilizing transposase RayT
MEGGRFVDTRTEQVGIRTRRLPHWIADGGIYFVTFRLGDSLPQDVVERLASVRDQTQRRRIAERELDKHFGDCTLQHPTVAQCVFDALNFFNGDRYVLDAACVMPNHVHVIVSPHDPHTLDAVLHSWKSFTSNAVNRLIGRQGRLWEPESFDHLVRNGESYERFMRYIEMNPIQAGLVDWPWVYLAPKTRESA